MEKRSAKPGAGGARRTAQRAAGVSETVRLRPSSDDQHQIVFFERHPDDDPGRASPGRKFLNGCPTSVRTKLRAVLAAVAAAPPKRFAGGGYWEAMHGEMNGWHEIRVDGEPRRTHYRLFCLLDNEAEGWTKPLLVVVTGMSKPFRTVLSERDYTQVRALGDEYKARNPRSLVQSEN